MITNMPVNALKEILTKNKDEHRGIYEEAVEAYSKEAMEWLKNQMDGLMRTKKSPVRLYFVAPVPEEHTEDYERVISMLEMTVDPTISLNESDYAKYVLNQWDWAHSWGSNTVSYTNRS